MIYYYSSPAAMKKLLKEMGVTSYLLSYAVDAKDVGQFTDFARNLIIDSGAFTVWNKGEGKIDIEAYLKFCQQQPDGTHFINLDVIPETGSSAADIERCCEEGWENYLFLKNNVENVMPVYHYGDNIKWLRKMMQETDYIGISPANDTHENVKREFLRGVYRVLGSDFKTHGLGYSSFDGLAMFPFYSIDSISFKRATIATDDGRVGFWVNKKLEYLTRQRIRQFQTIEKDITELWEKRGIRWK